MRPTTTSPRARLAVACAVLVLGTAAPSAAAAAAGTDDTQPTPTTVATGDTPTDGAPATDNGFLPEQRPLSDCISSLPKPDCGSKERGGWRQLTAFGVMLGGMAAIVTRIAWSIRRRDRTPDPDGAPAPR